MRELTADEISKDRRRHGLGYVIGNAVGSAAVSIGSALGDITGRLMQYAYPHANQASVDLELAVIAWQSPLYRVVNS